VVMLGIVVLFLGVFLWVAPKILGRVKRRFGFD